MKYVATKDFMVKVGQGLLSFKSGVTVDITDEKLLGELAANGYLNVADEVKSFKPQIDNKAIESSPSNKGADEVNEEVGFPEEITELLSDMAALPAEDDAQETEENSLDDKKSSKKKSNARKDK